MAVQNPNNLYTAGAVVFDSRPEVNLYAQLMQRKQAKNEAIDEYYKKLPHTLNSAGMRDQDRAGFDQKLAKTQQYWMQNKDKIRKGNSQEAFDYEQMFRELGTGVERSKGAAKTDLELGKMRFNKENGYIFDDPDFMDAQHKHALSVYDPDHKEMDLGTVTIPTKPLDAESKDKLWGIATKGIDPGKVYDYSKKYTNPQTGQVIVPFAKIHSEKQIIPIAENYAASIKGNKSAIKYYNDILDNADEATINQLQAAYSSKYPGEKVQGKNGTFIVPDLMDTPEKVAKAEAIIRASIPKETGEEQESNYQQKQDDKRININLNVSRGRGGDDVVEYDVLKKYEPKAVPHVEKIRTGNWLNPKVEEKTEMRIPASEVPIQHRDLIKTKPYTDDKTDEKYYILRDDKNWEGDGGQIISWETVAQSEMDRVTAAEARRGRQNLRRDGNTTTPKKTPKKGELD